MKKYLLLVALLLSPSIAAAFDNAGYEHGGRFVRFNPVIAKFNASGQLFRIGGLCKSACTTFLRIRNVCVHPGARFGFHAGSNRDGSISQHETRQMMASYNGALFNYLERGGYMQTLEYHYISGSDIISKFGYSACK